MLPDNLKSLSQKEQVRHVRLERRPKAQISAEEGSWAVSYSDMLMVLMSFFIIFFSFEDEKKENIISKIAKEMVPGLSAASIADTPASTQDSASASAGVSAKQVVSSLEKLALKVDWSSESDSLIVHLSDQLFRARKFEITGDVQKELNQVLTIMAPHRSHIHIKFIGHSDQRALSHTNTYLSNNNDLSALRASRALTYAMQKGFLPGNMSIESLGATERNSRTLSLKITPLK